MDQLPSSIELSQVILPHCMLGMLSLSHAAGGTASRRWEIRCRALLGGNQLVLQQRQS
eukprot:COSAG05_NODE_20956_length_275_cov_1.130682_1_plen_57_part_01